MELTYIVRSVEMTWQIPVGIFSQEFLHHSVSYYTLEKRELLTVDVRKIKVYKYSYFFLLCVFALWLP